MFDFYHFALNPIWNFYKAGIYYCDACFSPFGLCFWLKRHLVKTNLWILGIYIYWWSKLTLCTLGLLSSCAITTWSLKAVCGRENFQTLTRIWIWAHALCWSEAESRLKEEEQMWKEVLLRRISRPSSLRRSRTLPGCRSSRAERPMPQLP